MLNDTAVQLLQSLLGSLVATGQCWVQSKSGSVYLLDHGPAHQLCSGKALQQVPDEGEG